MTAIDNYTEHGKCDSRTGALWITARIINDNIMNYINIHTHKHVEIVKVGAYFRLRYVTCVAITVKYKNIIRKFCIILHKYPVRVVCQGHKRTSTNWHGRFFLRWTSLLALMCIICVALDCDAHRSQLKPHQIILVDIVIMEKRPFWKCEYDVFFFFKYKFDPT